MLETPTTKISWSLLNRAITYLINRTKIDVIFEKHEKNPFTMLSYNIITVKYKLTVRTHGWPKRQPDIIFPEVKKWGEIRKKVVSPSTLGEINGSMRLKLYKNELPSKSEIPINVNFEIQVNPEDFVTLNFIGDQNILDESNTEIEVLCTNNCDFALEQIFVSVSKDPTFKTKNLEIFILEKASHQKKSKVEVQAIRKADDHVKWLTRFNAKESILFKIVATDN